MNVVGMDRGHLLHHVLVCAVFWIVFVVSRHCGLAIHGRLFCDGDSFLYSDRGDVDAAEYGLKVTHRARLFESTNPCQAESGLHNQAKFTNASVTLENVCSTDL